MSTGSMFGPSDMLRGLRNARRTQRRPVRRTRYASGVTRCTARSILSATDETSSVMLIFGGEFYLKPTSDAMRGHEYKSVDKMNEIRTTMLEPMTNKVLMNHSDTLTDSRSAQPARASFLYFALPNCSW